MGFEILQPIEGPSIYKESLDRKGEGLHHAAVVAHSENVDAAPQNFKKNAISIIMSGRLGEGSRFYPIDTDRILKMTAETVGGHAISLKPVYIYPLLVLELTAGVRSRWVLPPQSRVNPLSIDWKIEEASLCYIPRPPVTNINSPVMKSDSSDARNNAAYATSSTFPNLLTAVSFISIFSSSGVKWATISVLM